MSAQGYLSRYLRNRGLGYLVRRGIATPYSKRGREEFFRALSIPSGVACLPDVIELNGTRVSPTMRYYGGAADASGWAAAGYGSNLVLNGASPTLNNGSPCLGGDDDSVYLDGGRYELTTDDTYGDGDSDDVIIEALVQFTDDDGAIFGKSGGGAVFELQVQASSNAFRFAVDDGVANAYPTSPSCVEGAWYLVHCILDKSGSAIVYRNAEAGTAVDASSVGAMTIAANYTVGARSGGGFSVNNGLAYFSMWRSSGWLDTHTQQAFVNERFARLMGVFPQYQRGDPFALSSAVRTTAARLDRWEGSTRQYFLVGKNWMRMCQRKDTSGDLHRGFLPEPSSTNLALQSQTLDHASWTKVAATVGADSANGPDALASLDGIVTADAVTDTQHGVTQAITLTAATYTISCFARKGAQDFLYLSDQTLTNGWAYFNLDTGSVGNSGADVAEALIEDWGGGLYRCSIRVTGTAAAHTIAVYASDADDNAKDPAFVGDGSSNEIHAGFVQVEQKDRATSYVETTTGTVTRAVDNLRYIGGPNIDGVAGDRRRLRMRAKVLLPNAAHPNHQRIIVLSDGGSGSDRVDLFCSATNGYMRTIVIEDGSTEVNTLGATDMSDGDKHDLLLELDGDRWYQEMDGARQGSIDNDVMVPDGLDRVDVGETESESGQFMGLISDLVFEEE